MLLAATVTQLKALPLAADRRDLPGEYARPPVSSRVYYFFALPLAEVQTPCRRTYARAFDDGVTPRIQHRSARCSFPLAEVKTPSRRTYARVPDDGVMRAPFIFLLDLRKFGPASVWNDF